MQRTVYGDGMWKTEIRDRDDPESKSKSKLKQEAEAPANPVPGPGGGTDPDPGASCSGARPSSSFSSSSSSSFNDTAYTSAALRCHTDGNYWTEPPRLQVFHCLKADAGGGGLSVLVDGLAAAERLRAGAPEAFAFFAGVRLPFGHVDSESNFIARHKAIVLREEDVFPGREALAPIERVHYNNDDRWVPLAAPEHVRASAR